MEKSKIIKIIVIMGLCAVLMVPVVSGCKKAATTETTAAAGETAAAATKGAIPWMTDNLEFTFEQIRQVGIRETCKKLGYTTWTVDSKLDGTKMIQDLEGIIKSKGVVGFVATPADPFGIEPYVKQLRANGIPVVCSDIGFKGPINAIAITPNYAKGQELAQFAYDSLKKLGKKEPFKVGLADVLPTFVEARKRAQGFRDKAKELGMQIVVDVTQQLYSAEAGYDTMQQIMSTGGPDLMYVQFTSGREAAGAANAVVAAGKDPLKDLLVCGYDGGPEEWQAIMDGKLFATFSQRAWDMGRIAVEVIDEILRTETPDNIKNLKTKYEQKYIDVPGDIITQENWKQKKAEYEARNGTPVVF